MIQEGDHYPDAEPERVQLTLENLLWIKKKIDPDNYDEKLLAACSIRRLPNPEPPPAFYRSKVNQLALIRERVVS